MSNTHMMFLINKDLTERNLLTKAGLFSKVKHVLDRFKSEGKYLVETDVFSNVIYLYYIQPAFNTDEVWCERVLI